MGEETDESMMGGDTTEESMMSEETTEDSMMDGSMENESMDAEMDSRMGNETETGSTGTTTESM